RFTLLAGGGGGWGDPFERSTVEVAADVAAGLVSREQARAAYGVALAQRDGFWTVDENATAAERTRSRANDQALVGGYVGVDRRLLTLIESRGQRPNVRRESLDAAVAAARDALDLAVCTGSCPRRADGRVCPFHAPEALANWNPVLFRDWARRRCPQAARVRLLVDAAGCPATYRWARCLGLE